MTIDTAVPRQKEGGVCCGVDEFLRGSALVMEVHEATFFDGLGEVVKRFLELGGRIEPLLGDYLHRNFSDSLVVELETEVKSLPQEMFFLEAIDHLYFGSSVAQLDFFQENIPEREQIRLGEEESHQALAEFMVWAMAMYEYLPILETVVSLEGEFRLDRTLPTMVPVVYGSAYGGPVIGFTKSVGSWPGGTRVLVNRRRV